MLRKQCTANLHPIPHQYFFLFLFYATDCFFTVQSSLFSYNPFVKFCFCFQGWDPSQEKNCLYQYPELPPPMFSFNNFSFTSYIKVFDQLGMSEYRMGKSVEVQSLACGHPVPQHRLCFFLRGYDTFVESVGCRLWISSWLLFFTGHFICFYATQLLWLLWLCHMS